MIGHHQCLSEATAFVELDIDHLEAVAMQVDLGEIEHAFVRRDRDRRVPAVEQRLGATADRLFEQRHLLIDQHRDEPIEIVAVITLIGIDPDFPTVCDQCSAALKEMLG